MYINICIYIKDILHMYLSHVSFTLYNMYLIIYYIPKYLFIIYVYMHR